MLSAPPWSSSGPSAAVVVNWLSQGGPAAKRVLEQSLGFDAREEIELPIVLFIARAGGDQGPRA